MPDVQWYYARDDQPMGPVSASELRQLAETGELKPDDLLWREGMEEWTTAINLRGLFDGNSARKGDIATAVVERRAGERAGQPPAPGGLSGGAQLESLVRTTQIVLWATCVLVVLVGVVLFTRAFLRAENAAEEAASGAVFATFFLAAYVLARSGEKLAQLLISYGKTRSK